MENNVGFSFLCWVEDGERKLIGLEYVQMTADKVKVIRDKLKAVQDRQKSFADNRRKILSLTLEIGFFFFFF